MTTRQPLYRSVLLVALLVASVAVIVVSLSRLQLSGQSPERAQAMAEAVVTAVASGDDAAAARLFGAQPGQHVGPLPTAQRAVLGTATPAGTAVLSVKAEPTTPLDGGGGHRAYDVFVTYRLSLSDGSIRSGRVDVFVADGRVWSVRSDHV